MLGPFLMHPGERGLMARSRQDPPGRRRSGAEPVTDSGDDAFLARALSLSYWARERKHVLVVLGIAVVIVGVGLFYFFDQRSADRQEAADALEGLHAMAEAGQQDQARAELESFLQQYSGIPETMEGRLLLGRIQLEEGDAEAAVTTLEPLAEDLGDPMGLDGAFLLGHAFEELERWEESEDLYLRIRDAAELGFQQRQALEAAARARTELGNHAEAVTLYEEILGLLDPDDPRRGRFQMKLAEAEARAEG